MGIDIYMVWKDQTEDEARAQVTGFDTTAGAAGYLREAYHGSPYATKVLLPETWEDHPWAPDAKLDPRVEVIPGEVDPDYPDDGPTAPTFRYPAALLRERLPATVAACITRCRLVYNEEVDEDHEVVQSYVRFVELAERKEAETGEPVTIINSY